MIKLQFFVLRSCECAQWATAECGAQRHDEHTASELRVAARASLKAFVDSVAKAAWFYRRHIFGMLIYVCACLSGGVF